MHSNIDEKNKYLVTKVNLTESIRNLPAGRPVLFTAATCGSMSSARSAICRLTHAGEGSWNLSSSDNGATYTITRTK